jgi:tetratricopeptide (TPR) repeat protein
VGEHPTIDELQQFLEKQSASGDRELNRRVVRHLLSGCSYCKRCLQALSNRLAQPSRNLDLPASEECSPSYETMLARAEEALSFFLSNGRPVKEPPGSLLAELAPLPRGETSHRGASIPLLIKWTIGKSHAARLDDPDAMQNWALMARLAGESCTAAEAGSAAKLADLRARAWAQYATSLRVQGFLLSADKAVSTAQQYLGLGTGDLSLRSWFLGLTASLRNDQGNYREAAELADRAGEASSLAGDTRDEGRSLLIQTNAWYFMGEVDASIDLLRRALDRAEYRRDPQWKLMAQHNLLQSYVHANQLEEAQALAIKFGPQSQSTPSILRLKIHWLQGELLVRQGCLEEAETALLGTYNGFVRKKMVQEIADLCAQLVSLYGEISAANRAERLVTRTLGTLRSLGAESNVLASITRLSTSSIG